MTKKRLSVVSSKDQKLGRPTIMDRALAQRYGTSYVILAAFAIDVDRVRELDPENPTLPFGWEVLLTERYVAQLVEAATKDPVPLLEEACLSVIDMPRPKRGEQAPLGSQLPFAVYAALARGHVPNAVGSVFHSWKKPPTQLLEELAELEREAGIVARLARHCLTAEIEPGLVPPVREALEKLASEG